MSISGLVVEYIVAIDVTRVRFPADAICMGRLLAACVGQPPGMPHRRTRGIALAHRKNGSSRAIGVPAACALEPPSAQSHCLRSPACAVGTVWPTLVPG